MRKKRPAGKQPVPTRPEPIAQPALQTPSIAQVLGYDPAPPMTPMDVDISKMGWSKFTLSDGTVIRLKGVLIDAKKAIDQYVPDGKPIYIAQMTIT